MWKWLLKKVMNYIVGKDVFGQVQTMVTDIALNDKMTGDEKKAKVITDAKELGTDFASHMLNFAVEGAVLLLKDQATKK